MTLNALSNLTKTADTSHRVPDKAKAASGFETVFQEESTAESSSNGLHKAPDSVQGKAESNGSPDREVAKSSTAQEAVKALVPDSVPPEAVLATNLPETTKVPESSLNIAPEQLSTSAADIDQHNAGTGSQAQAQAQAQGDKQTSGVIATDLRNVASGTIAHPSPVREDASKTPDPEIIQSATNSTRSRTTGRTLIDTAADVGSRSPLIPAGQNSETQTLSDTAETNVKGALPSIDAAVKSHPTTVAMVTETASADSRSQVVLPPTMSLLDRHLGGYPVRLLPQNVPAQEGVQKNDSAGWTERTPTVTMANVMAPQNAPAVASSGLQALPGLAGSGNMNPAQLQASLRQLAEPKSGISQGETPQEISWDVRPGTAQTTSSLTQPIAARPELAAHVAQQIADAMKGAGNKSIEISLSPVELGRVRMVLSPSDAGLTLNILAERPDTLDMMRRNIDDLTKSFSELGYEDISFSFAQSDQMTDDGTQTSDDSDDQMIVQTDLSDLSKPGTGPTRHLAIAPDGIDMRL